jgi:hypothetical protein
MKNSWFNGNSEGKLNIHSWLQLGGESLIIIRGGNRAGRVGFEFGFGSDGSGQFDFLEEIGSDRVGSGSGRVGSIYMLYFFRSLIYFD